MKREYELIFVCLGFLLIIIGVILQYKVIINNDCKMPVLNSPDADYSKEHFNFIDKEEISNYYLSDIIGWENERVSIGDVFIWLGIIIVWAFSIRYSIKLYKDSQKSS